MSAPTGNQAPAAEGAWPNETYHVDYKKLAADTAAASRSN